MRSRTASGYGSDRSGEASISDWKDPSLALRMTVVQRTPSAYRPGSAESRKTVFRAISTSRLANPRLINFASAKAGLALE